MRIRTNAFDEGERIPERFTGEGEDVSPALTIEEVPEGTRSLAVIVDDPDAPRKTFVHWLVWGIPADRGEIPEAVPLGKVTEEAGGARQGKNDFGDVGYSGPMPPRGHGTHHYRFTAYALSEPVDLVGGASREALERAIGDCTLATARITGTYSRG